MGMGYVVFRLIYIIKTKLGWQKKVFPINPKFNIFHSLKDWKENLPPFFFYEKIIRGLEKKEMKILK